MRRKRQQLQVSTFPFIAVLLCAMGSLVLLLLVLDRRAKQSARNKAIHEQKNREYKEKHRRELLLTKRNAEWANRKRELHARLLHQENKLRRQLQRTRTKQEVAKSALAKQAARRDGLVQSLRLEKKKLERTRWEWHRAVQVNRAKTKKTEETARQLAAVNRQLLDLEKTVKALKLFRKQSQNVYSIVPFKGANGTNRRPLYVECDGRGVLFQPSGVRVKGARSSAILVRLELQRRLTSALATKKTHKPYVFVLVRPDGVENYYAVRAALAGLPADFGYELIEQNWRLDFSSTGKAIPPPPMVVAAPPFRSNSGKKTKGLRGGGITKKSSGAGDNPVWKPFAGAAAQDQEKPAAKSSEPGLLPKGLIPENNVKSFTHFKKGFPAGAPGSPNLQNGKNPPHTPPKTPIANGGNTALRRKGKERAPGTTKRQDANAKESQQTPAKGKSGSADKKGSANRHKGGQANRPSNPTKRKDWYISIECTARGVVCSLTDQRFSLSELRTTVAGEHSLAKSIRQIIARRHKTIRPGERQYRPMLRFDVHPNGLRCYHTVYPLLERLNLPMSRRNIPLRPPSIFDNHGGS